MDAQQIIDKAKPLAERLIAKLDEYHNYLAATGGRIDFMANDLLNIAETLAETVQGKEPTMAICKHGHMASYAGEDVAGNMIYTCDEKHAIIVTPNGKRFHEE